MSVSVRVLREAERDMADILAYLRSRAGAEVARALLEKFEHACLFLDVSPERGHAVPELDGLGMTAFREIHVYAYRMIYEINGRDVYVHALLDGRRELRQLLERRLLR